MGFMAVSVCAGTQLSGQAPSAPPGQLRAHLAPHLQRSSALLACSDSHLQPLCRAAGMHFPAHLHPWSCDSSLPGAWLSPKPHSLPQHTQALPHLPHLGDGMGILPFPHLLPWVLQSLHKFPTTFRLDFGGTSPTMAAASTKACF